VVIVEVFIVSLKVAVTLLLMATPVESLNGMVELTMGAVASGVGVGLEALGPLADTGVMADIMMASIMITDTTSPIMFLFFI
jgi:hypothetical protein